MKHIFYIVLLMPTLLFAQVGINTTQPTKTLDVNGELRVRNTPSGDMTDYLLVVNALGEVRKIPISALSTYNSTCPTLMRNDSNPYFLKFTSSTSIPNPNNPITVNGVTWGFSGTFNSNNLYHYSYSNPSGIPLNLNQSFTVMFSTTSCTYTP